MNEEEKESIELDIEAKYVDRTEKEFLSRVTYAECLYILTPKNKYCDKIKELSVLKLCEIIEKLQKENELAKQALIKNCNIGDARNQLLKENEKLKNKLLDTLQKIKDKMKYLDNQQKQFLEDRKLKASDREIIFARDILQELLEDNQKIKSIKQTQ